jgi:hypothetical protein
VSDVESDRLRNTQGFLTKNVKEIFWDLKFLWDHTGSTVHIKIHVAVFFSLEINFMQKNSPVFPLFQKGIDAKMKELTQAGIGKFFI